MQDFLQIKELIIQLGLLMSTYYMQDFIIMRVEMQGYEVVELTIPCRAYHAGLLMGVPQGQVR